MTATALAIAPKLQAVQYDGSNSSDINALIPDFTILSEVSGMLTFQSNTGTHFVASTGYILWNESGIVTETVTAGVFDDAFHVLPTVGALNDLGEQLDSLAEQLEALPDALESAGAVTFPAIGASQSATVAVTLAPPMPDADYTAYAQLFGGVNLGNLAITAVDPVDADTVNVTVQNSGLLSLGASVLVTATSN